MSRKTGHRRRIPQLPGNVRPIQSPENRPGTDNARKQDGGGSAASKEKGALAGTSMRAVFWVAAK